MKILLVEDNPDDLLFAKHALGKLGHMVIGVDNGASALEKFDSERPDLVITDIYMPGMDGFTLTRAVQQRAAPRWQPVLFLSGYRDDELQVKALQVGADGYVVKPVSAELLDARLKVIERLLIMQRQAEERARELESYYAAEEEEKRVAEHLIRRLVNADKLNDPAIDYWISPAALFSGDLIAAARTPAHVLHVLLADGTGHGLSASINVLPIIAPFYRMTEKGFGIDAIAREMNQKVRQFLPEDRFVAATLAAIDFREGYVRVWNGGNPEPILLGPTGRAEHMFGLRHTPLGILEDDEFETLTETHAFGHDAQLALYSDGVIEAESPGGEMFGFERLAAAMDGAAPEERLKQAVAAVVAHMGTRAAHDDISLLVVNSRSDAPVADTTAGDGGNGEPIPEPGNWKFGLRLGAMEVRKVDVVPLLLGLVNQFDGARHRSGELFVILSELFNNALDHGLLRLDSRRKLDPDGMEVYLNQREERLQALNEGEIELEIELFPHAGRNWLRIVCRDTGPGFDHARVLGVPSQVSELPFGRGLALVRSLASSFELNDTGNAVTAILSLGHGRDDESPVI
ncbi:MAG: fused response regulator/phosphatase [Sterolibacteriaceae bacterium MAG5]|nr:fused response regulator/phosphatase [Candidatus Nitricoxidireducens bremensis]